MPIWDRMCNQCETTFAVTCTFAKKEEVKECPSCGNIDGTYLLSAPTLSRHSERLMTHKKDAGFGEVLSKIKEKNPRTPLANGRQTGGTGLDFIPS